MAFNRIVTAGKNPTNDAMYAGDVYNRIAYNISYPECTFFMTREPAKEMQFVYEYFKLEIPDNISKAKINDKTEFVLIGHNKKSQVPDFVDPKRIIAVIDNHPVQFNGENQIYFRTEPVGANCTVLTEMLLEHAQLIPVEVAKLLVTGIISETYLFTSPFTKAIDRQMVDRLNKIAQIVNIQVFAEKLFEKKADISDEKIEDVVGEREDFEIAEKKISIRTVFTPKPDKTLERKNDFIAFLKNTKEEISIIAVIDIVNKSSYFLVANPESMKIVEDGMMFGEKVDEFEYDMQGVSSVKNELIPAIESVLG